MFWVPAVLLRRNWGFRPDGALLPAKQSAAMLEANKEVFFAVGRVMAMSITKACPLDVCFSRCLYKVCRP